MSSQFKTAYGLRLNVLIACILAMASILFSQWDAVKSRITEIVKSPASRIIVVEQSDETLREIYVAENCPEHDYRIRIFSHDPLIIYIEDFISKRERSYMVTLAEEYYEQSRVTDDDNTSNLSDDRTSQSAFIYHDPIANCIRKRAADFQGGIPMENMEELQAVKYHVGRQYRNHYDWGLTDVNPRISTFFAYAACDQTPFGNMTNDNIESGRNLTHTTCEGGATNFPDYEDEIHPSWCDVVDCEDEDSLGGVSFRAIPGNAVFWSNVYPNGTYHPGTMHAGVPIKSGTKVGINIWTRRHPFDPDMDAPWKNDLEEKPIEEVYLELPVESDIKLEVE